MAALALITPAACGSESEAPTQEEASRVAHSANARRASASSAEQVSATLAAVTRSSSLRPVATSTHDMCRAGVTDSLWPHDDYRVRCSRDETRYVEADGDLLDVLRDVDKRARAVGLIPVTTSAIEDVERYHAANGRTEDGLLLSLPTLSYLVPGPGHDSPLQVRWPQERNPFRNQPVPDLTWPIVFVDSHPVDVDALQSDLLRRHRYLLTVNWGTTYLEIPWPA